ncbi:MAG: hypothetical protein U1F68_11020 [Gammaproteobacteria bacterium]
MNSFSREIDYTRDGLGRIQSIVTTANGETKTLVSNVTYQPFGGVNGFTFGNGQAYARTFDRDGRINGLYPRQQRPHPGL